MSYTIKGDSAVLQVVAAIVREHGVQVKIEGKGVPAGQLELTTAQGAKVGPATAYNLARLLSRLAPASGLYGAQGDALVATEVDTWVDFAASHLPESGVTEAGLARSLASLDTHLRLRTYLVGSALSLADVAVVLALSEVNKQWAAAARDGKFVEVTRWATHLATLAPFGKRVHYPGKKHEREPSSSGAASASSGAAPASKSLAYQHASDNQVIKNQSAKFVVLPGAEMGKVVTRFPPEASGYLHVGHAKAALLNEYYARIYEGTLIMRFDDTNPAKENSEFEQAILEDLESLGIKPDKFTHTSDWFDTILQYGERMLKEGKAFVDDTPVDKMRSEREARQNSYRRDASVEDNLKLWAEMIKGSPVGLTCCMRAKIDMQSNNGALRDPVMFRCKNEIHVRTGDKYKCYPTYDMACPIVDSLEGVTHALRTTEYHDRDAQFYWIIDALGLRKPMIYDYSRVNLSYTVLSKRKLQKLVDMKLVDGWNDPRFPTVRGVLRRGMTVGALRDFIISIGSSKNSNLMEWDKFWGYNKKHIDPVAPRFTAIERDSAVPIRVLNGPATPEETDVQLHPKDASIGTKKVVRANALIMERVDADAIKEGEIITLMNWGNHIVRKIYREHGKPIASVDVEYLPEDKDFKKTQKFTWIANVPGKSLVPVLSSDFDYLIIKPKIEEEDNIDDILTPKTRFDTQLLAEPAAANLKKGDIIQFNRRGYYIVDAKNDDGSFTMFLIPDGSAEMVASKAAAASGAIASNPALKKEAAAPATPAGTSSDAAVAKLADQITAQGNTVRDLKAAKGDATAAVAELLKLKAEYKALTGKDFAPGARPAAAPAEDKKKAAAPAAAAPAATAASVAAAGSGDEAALAAKITAQGNIVRDLKAAKGDATAAVAELLKLKAEYKTLTGKDFAPGARPAAAPAEDKKKAAAPAAAPVAAAAAAPAAAPAAAAASTSAAAGAPVSDAEAALAAKISAQGNVVRDLKTAKADATAALAELLKLKGEFKALTGKEYTAPGARPVAEKKTPTPAAAAAAAAPAAAKAEAKPAKEKAAAASSAASSAAEDEKRILIGVEADKATNFHEWYTQTIVRAEMIEYYDISGCYILRPWACSVWDHIRDFFDREIKLLGVENAYFPMFVSKSALEKEADHIADFAPEVAWVTKSGQSDLAEPIALRPTSETIMYPSFAKWIRSHRDLPLKINQWANVVRWEFKNPTPFLRTREFLWQEGHTAYETKPEADKEVLQILELYRRVYEEYLAVPVIKGKKSEKEKFAGGLYTTTVEAIIPSTGRGVQGATSHNLGQNFSKMFDILIEDNDRPGQKKHVWQNSWGLTTRTIGVMIMLHGDNKGLVLPPRVASLQAVIVPCGITASLSEADRAALMAYGKQVEDALRAGGIRVKFDDRDNYTPGYKFNHWELRGVPLRIEVGPRDMKNKQIVAVRRDTGEKTSHSVDNIATTAKTLLTTIQDSLLARATAVRDAHVRRIENWEDFVPALNAKCAVLAPWCDETPCEEDIKKSSAKVDTDDGSGAAMGAKSLCKPFEQPELKAGQKCVKCDKPAKVFCLFGRSY